MNRPVGAYGLRVEGLPAALLNPAPPEWPLVNLVPAQGAGTSNPAAATFTGTRARIPMPDGGEIVVTRSPLVADVRLPTMPSAGELLHPYLGYVAVVVARWLARDCVHAGAFAVDGGAFALVGARGTGKSSVLGLLSRQGHGVVCDDVLVVGNGSVFAGPRFVDLRAEAAERLRAGEPIGIVGARERWRLPLPPVAPEIPLRGWLLLEWGSELAVERIAAGTALMRIHEQLSLFTAPREAIALLDLASFPAWRVTRPFGWESIEATVAAALAAVSAS